jgi:hypothetical protein
MRPRSIVLFDILYFIFLAATLIGSVLSFSRTEELLNATPAMAAAGVATIMLYMTLAFTIGISLLLWFFVSRRASSSAKWILVAFTGIAVLGMISAFKSPMISPAQLAINGFATVFQIAAVVMLFRRDATNWFEGKAPVDPNVFD